MLHVPNERARRINHHRILQLAATFQKARRVGMLTGADSSAFAKMSPTVPPATLRKAEPDRPDRKRPTSMVAMLGATAHGISQIRKQRKL